MNIGVSLVADCSKCAALCCVSFAFEKSDQISLTKKSGMPCPNLNNKNECNIHDDLVVAGFKGCVRYTCFGAGQRVTQEVFHGANWQADRALLSPMLDSFFIMTRIHELLVILIEADTLDLSKEKRQIVAEFITELTPSSGWNITSLHSFEQSNLEREVRGFFTSLRDGY